MIIKELKIDDNVETGVQAVSFVDEPAIEADFEYFWKEGNAVPFFQYYASPPLQGNSHDFCIQKVNSNIKWFHIKEIRQDWNDQLTAAEEQELIVGKRGRMTGVNWFATFTGRNANVDNAIYNCRHKLLRAPSMDVVRADQASVDHAKQLGYWKNSYDLSMETAESTTFVELSIQNEEQRIVTGPLLVSGKMIYRKDIHGLGEGYIFFSRDTVRKLQKKYGWNRNISFMHQQNIIGNAIMLNTWLSEDDKNNQTTWNVSYKILPTTAGEKVWQLIKTKKLVGFSVESIFSL